ncbi:hypothetical protein FPQ18DRAFT_368804 [Pyronema domesticum]|uniref:SnoaL-like domain-containing protein n=1 Tax=Pyronema omphalodes (strain CBS 100304) TaxID=1076935 RepID=U4LCY8_PYROM|nr:hypothetical protein FPQ18DRAFT_368804 [Pyronema domesticum]CCX08374.1 Similar to hypothetical protein [Tuber melanosporum Mel28]; acc. no. XP_002841995 [Pyronema omphalodes CBS 100304]
MSHHTKPTLIIAVDEATFDISPWDTEGYAVHLLTKANKDSIEYVTDELESSDRYAILAFGTAASHALSFATKPSRQLRSVAAYYPTSLPSSSFHPDVRVLLHLPQSTPFSLPTSSNVRVRLYDAPVGFAQTTLPTFSRLSHDISFSRTLSLLRATIGPYHIDLEAIWDEHLAHEFASKNPDATMDTMISSPYVNHVPTLTGGSGYDDLYRFYKDYFIPNNPPSMRVTLVSRTVGSDRIVDEMVISFRHSCEVPWMLPGVPPTEKEVEVALVSVVAFRGGKLAMENIYWDQASVLVQIGLLERGNLPIVGVESARKVLDKKNEPSNKLVPGWSKDQ